MGPKRDNIEYFEIARCMGTLMTNKVIKLFIKKYLFLRNMYVNIILKRNFTTVLTFLTAEKNFSVVLRDSQTKVYV